MLTLNSVLAIVGVVGTVASVLSVLLLFSGLRRDLFEVKKENERLKGELNGGKASVQPGDNRAGHPVRKQEIRPGSSRDQSVGIDADGGKQRTGKPGGDVVARRKRRSRRVVATGVSIAIAGILLGGGSVYLYVLSTRTAIDILEDHKSKLHREIVRLGEDQGQQPQQGVTVQGLRGEITVTRRPLSGAGPFSKGEIAGSVRGLASPEKYKVVIYSLTDHWYVQPTTEQPFTDIDSKGSWSNWTHLGDRYAAILVEPTYKPHYVIDALPAANGEVLGRADVPAR